MVMVQTIRFLPVHTLRLSQCADKPAGYTSDLGRRFTFGHWVVTPSDYPGMSLHQVDVYRSNGELAYLSPPSFRER
jgi:hypothetical protein